MAHNSLSMYLQFTVHYTAILQYTFYTQLCVNNSEVTVNTYTCTDVFTVIIQAARPQTLTERKAIDMKGVVSKDERQMVK